MAGGGKCILECGRRVATHTKTNICSACLGNLAFWRRRTAAARLKYRATLNVRVARQEEIEKFPKGYRITGRPTKKVKSHDD